MNRNLVTDAWLPVFDGNQVKRITPLDLLRSDHANLAYAQPDLRAGAVELLVCMAQTAVPPKDDEEWRAWMKRGTFPGELEERWNRLAPAFFVRHDERPFMQDPSLDVSKPKRIELLDATRSPDNAVTEGRALFAQPDDGYRLSVDEAALRVWIYQSWSPVSSSKLRGSYRGHAPLSTLVRLPTLRQTVLANLLPAPDDEPLAWLGWGGSLSNQHQEPHLKHRNHLDPRSALWVTPRRVRLAWDGDAAVGFANGSIRGQLSQTVPHPHSPGRVEKEKWVSGQGRVLGHGYPALLHLLMNPAKAKKKEVEPALVITNYHYQGEWGLPEARMWAYGYHVENNVDGWNETTAPLVEPDDATRATIDRALVASDTILKSLWRACYEVIRDEEDPSKKVNPKPDDVKRLIPRDALRDRYYRATEAAFWNVVEAKQHNLAEATKTWKNAALSEARRLLDEWLSGFPETRLAGRVRARHVMDGLRWRKELNIIMEAT